MSVAGILQVVIGAAVLVVAVVNFYNILAGLRREIEELEGQ